MTQTLAALLAAANPDAPAIGAPDRPWLTYAGLAAQTARTRAALHGAGVGRGDRVAIVLPNGPEMASAFVTHRAGRRHRAAEPGLQAGRVRLLSVRPEGQGHRPARRL